MEDSCPKTTTISTIMFQRTTLLTLWAITITTTSELPQPMLGMRVEPRFTQDAMELYACPRPICVQSENRSVCALWNKLPRLLVSTKFLHFSAGHFQFQGNSYWFSMASSENALRNARWNWFTGRNYCRKMCMDMVSFESQAEENFVEDILRRTNVDNIHLAGRLCDAEVEGCNQTRFQPLQINGWFWASTLKMMPPTNQASNNQIVSTNETMLSQ